VHDPSPRTASSLETGAAPLVPRAEAALARRLFSDARTHAHWLPRPVAPALLHELVRLVQRGPTSMNTQPLRLQFLVSDAAKARLEACVNAGNVAKTRSAPVVAIPGMDLDFPERLPRLGFEDIARIV